MATQPRLVNKQFNSPIGLYSQQNVQEVLQRESQILANGAVGINFYNPDSSAPTNLKNSAVLRMLQEEENRQRNGIGPGAKRVAWPPPNESGPESPYVEQNAVSQKGGPQYPTQSLGLQQNNYQAPAQQSVSSPLPSHRPLKPLDVSTGGSSPLSSPLLNQSPQGFRSPASGKGWAPVHSPVATPGQPSWPQSTPRQQQSSTHFQAAHQSVSQQTYLGQQYFPTPQHQAPQQQYQPSQQQYQPSQQQYQSPKQQYQPPQQQYQPPQQQYQSPQQQYQPPQQQYQPPQQQYQPPQQQYQPPQQQYQPLQQQYQPPQQQYQPPQQQYQAPQQQNQAPQQYQASSQQNQVPQQYQASSQQYQSHQPSQFSATPAAAQSQAAPRGVTAASKPVEPPPSTITLRSQAPVRQAPPPVITSQPATATLRGGKHLRGDLKWPPENVKRQVEEENRLLLELAKGASVRPKRPNKDYTEFFEQHALNSTYPGYKIPPGTQFYRPE